MPGEVLLIDHADSFTYNIADLLHRVLGRPPVLWAHDHPATPAELGEFAAIVVGPGPGRPQVAQDMGLSDLALRQREVPVLGVCLGHQGLAHVAGEQVREMSLTRHGIVSDVEHDGTGLFQGVLSPLRVVRYHSLEVAVPLVSGLRVTARALDDGCVMALADPERPFWGVQFHPESVLSEHGELIVANFLRLAGVDPTPATEANRASVAVGDALGPHAHRSGGRPVSVQRCRLDAMDCWDSSGVGPDVGPDVARVGSGVGWVGSGVGWVGSDDLPERRTAAIPGPLDTVALAPVLQELLLGDAPTSVWLDASDGTGWSLLVDSRGPLSFELKHRVGEGATLMDRLDDLLGDWHLVDAPVGPGSPVVSQSPVPSTSATVTGSAVGEQAPPVWRPGFVGYLGYELKAETGGSAAHRSPWPDAWLTFADRGVVLDHETGALWAVWLEDDQVRDTQRDWVLGVGAALAEALHRLAVGSTAPFSQDDALDPPSRGRADAEPPPVPPAPLAPLAHPVLTPRDEEEAYLRLVQRAQAQIARGESYEICLTTTYRAEAPDLRERETYLALREVSPVPRGAWLRTPEVSVLSGSPERFVSVDGATGAVEARPIKGTRPRGATPEADAALAADLATAVKDRAENLMIVDLLRNDLHRVCRSGSVRVPELFAVETYATVHQLVSTVRGALAPGMGPTDVLRACFPGGSMTGAPKVRTMEILDELEAAPRGVYSGAIGWLGLDGSMDTSIVIRTLTRTPEGELAFGVGGAITALSDPAEEYAETRAKAQAMLRAVDRAVDRTAARAAGARAPGV
ncbi:aminodeoxychorismate synthase component I [Serinicoccus profundi]|uniref:aminodeoxychorismate synthase component I n=1 Tax=Serinicoccus profundi TaxID=1078471 RepID=UPI000255E6AB|nr:aminodeoxychorismate synthase component I [Serinicoccus profundi]